MRPMLLVYIFFLMFGAVGSIVYAETESPIESAPRLTATLVNPEINAPQHSAVIKVSVTGIKLIDPGKVGEKPVTGQGHLHYQVDNGFVIATPDTKLSLHDLAPGSHTVKVELVGNDHKPLGPTQLIAIQIPSGSGQKVGK